MEFDALTPEDSLPRPTSRAGLFFPGCTDAHTLHGAPENMPEGTPCTVVLRTTPRHGVRVLVRTASGLFRWEDPSFLIPHH